MGKERILVVEDEGIAALHLEESLAELGYACAGCAMTGEEAIAMARSARPDLVLMDIKLGEGMDGIEAGQRIQSELAIPVVLLTAHADEVTIARAKRVAPFGYLVKPATGAALRSTLEMAGEKFRLERALAESNRSLELFAELAAHDLRAPARQISLFLSLLVKECPDLSPRSRELLDLATGCAKRMRALVDDLLEFSRLTREKVGARPVDLEQTVARLVSELRPDVERSRAEVILGTLPTVLGNPHQLARLFQNLLDNALKYAGDGARIEIASRVEGDRATIAVRDDGPGVPAEERERIFDLFYRGCPGASEGTGIGLATCRKIAESHGGRIWVESGSGGGAVFLVTLPLARSAPPGRRSDWPGARDSLGAPRDSRSGSAFRADGSLAERDPAR